MMSTNFITDSFIYINFCLLPYMMATVKCASLAARFLAKYLFLCRWYSCMWCSQLHLTILCHQYTRDPPVFLPVISELPFSVVLLVLSSRLYWFSTKVDNFCQSPISWFRQMFPHNPEESFPQTWDELAGTWYATQARTFVEHPQQSAWLKWDSIRPNLTRSFVWLDEGRR